MQLSLFRSRTFSAGNVTGLIVSFGMMGVFFLLPVFLQAILGYSAIRAGLVLTPLAAVVIVAAPTAGALSDRVGSRWLIFSGILVAAVGFVLTGRAMSLDATWFSLVVPFMVSGFGIGMVIPPMTSAVMGSAPTEKAGQASGVLSTMRQIGSVLGIAVMGAVLQNRAVANVAGGHRREARRHRRHARSRQDEDPRRRGFVGVEHGPDAGGRLVGRWTARRRSRTCWR